MKSRARHPHSNDKRGQPRRGSKRRPDTLASLGEERDQLRKERDRLREERKKLREHLMRVHTEFNTERSSLDFEHRALRDAQAELEGSRDHYADLLDFAPIGFATLTPDGIITNINLTGSTILGWMRPHLRGKPLSVLVDRSNRREFYHYLTSLRHTTDELKTELWFVKGSEKLLLEFTGVMARGTWDGYLRIRIAFRDVTSQRQATDALQKAKDELEERVQERTAELRETLERANDLYHKAPCGYHSLDPNGVFVEINDTGLELLGYTREELIGKKSVFDLQAPHNIKNSTESFQRLQQEGAIHNLELDFIRKDGSTLPVILSASSVRDAAGNFLRSRSTFIDISARKRAERALRQTEARLQSILDNSPEMVFLKDLDGRYLHCNRRFLQSLHLTPEQAIGKTDFDLFAKNDAQVFRGHDKEVIESGQAIQFEEITEHEDGPRVSIVSKFPIHDLEGSLYAVGGIVTDVTERKRLEAEVLRISEHEQQRIAQDLHDGLGQQLAGTWFLSDTLRKNLLAAASPETETATKIVGLLETAVSQTRSLARGLYPVPQQPDGLMAGLEELASSLSILFGVPCQFVCPKPVPVADNKVATNLYRIAQEAGNNAIKHGKATRVEFRLFATEEHIVLKIADDGSGIKKIPKRHKGMGLRTMNYRAELIGADFAIQRTGSRGTEVVCSVRKL